VGHNKRIKKNTTETKDKGRVKTRKETYLKFCGFLPRRQLREKWSLSRRSRVTRNGSAADLSLSLSLAGQCSVKYTPVGSNRFVACSCLAPAYVVTSYLSQPTEREQVVPARLGMGLTLLWLAAAAAMWSEGPVGPRRLKDTGSCKRERER
jgi:hypothetical protein